MAQLLLTLIGDDREGLVSALSSVVAQHDGNWLESQMARLGGKFAGVALVELPDARSAAFTAAVASVDGLDVAVTPALDKDEEAGTSVVLHLVGNDHPGIVRDVTAVLAERGIGIDDMHTATRPAPMADTMLFEATAQVRLPEGVAVDELRAALEEIAAELMVDLDFDESVDDA
ncbi:MULTISPECIES: glycine cleavage system protein R [unclassified Luteococcus]|uniref:glycine cleavage system protein R n=1 Tax=unclassified Luteococcus TaxID=2639923 RepID=UPI00313C3412